MDDIADYALELIDENTDQKGNANILAKVKEDNDNKEFNNGILLSGSYLTHDYYRGRDFGDVQNSFSGTAAYIHKTGLGAYLSYYNLMNTKAFVDEFDIGITYQFKIIEDYFDGSVALAHSWYNDSNSKGVGGLNNLINASFNYSYGVLGVSAMFDLLFGGGTREFSFTFNPYCTIPVSKNFLSGALSVEPGITAIIGQQDYSVLQKRKRNPLKTVQTNSTFGIMDYEFSLPIEYEHKYFTFRPAITLIIPVNVLDLSTNKPFGCFSLDVELPISF